MTSLANILDNHPEGKSSVLIPGGPTITYGELRDEVERTAEILATVVAPGQAVSIVLPNGLEFLVSFLAVARAGAIAAPLNSAYTLDEFKFFMEDATPNSPYCLRATMRAAKRQCNSGYPHWTRRWTPREECICHDKAAT